MFRAIATHAATVLVATSILAGVAQEDRFQIRGDFEGGETFPFTMTAASTLETPGQPAQRSTITIEYAYRIVRADDESSRPSACSSARSAPSR